MFELTDAALNVLGKSFVKALKERIRATIYPYGNPSSKGVGNKIASGQLYNSIKYRIVKGDKGKPSTIEISWSDYFENVNVGRAPKTRKVPINALLEWIKIKGLKGRNKKGRFIKNMSLAFAIQTNIYKYGIRPKKKGNLFYDPALETLEQIIQNPPAEYQQALNGVWESLGQDINNLLEKTLTVRQ